MFKALSIMFVAAVLFSWVAVAVDLIGQEDDHRFKVLDCMSEIRHNSDIGPEEAFLLCEKENPR
jgi:hypothetical protein